MAYDKNISLKELAEAAGVSGAMMTKIVKGEKNPSVEKFARIAAKLGVTMDELAKDRDVPERAC
ncbi:MAG: helix-turn-helix transcriptional regulator [Clostridia bacterium]|nr:helix-turn-helix transcriptional regulator [Clostridia bacterium]